MKNQVLICLDCEATGLDISEDKIIEIAAIKFTLNKTIDSFSTLIDPCRMIPIESQNIHNISKEMIQGKPKINEILPNFLKFVDSNIIIGHGISFDISLIQKEAKIHDIPCKIDENKTIDTLRLARLYGKCSVNSLEKLKEHFNIDSNCSHRALDDVKANIGVFKKLITPFSTIKGIFQRLERPILMKIMPLGKYKGREFSDIPSDYLRWASNKDFDQDLLFSIRSEIKKRNIFSSPFADL